MHIGLKIKELRKIKLLTQEKLAEMTGISERTIRRLEKTGKAGSATLLSIFNSLEIEEEEFKDILKKDNTLEDESKGEVPDVSFLRRVENGSELSRIIANAHQYGYSYDDCNTEEQMEIAKSFLSNVADVLDLWGMVEIGQRFELENELSKQIKLLEENGLWVFGTRKVDKTNNNWVTAIVVIYLKNNPSIQKKMVDKNIM